MNKFYLIILLIGIFKFSFSQDIKNNHYGYYLNGDTVLKYSQINRQLKLYNLQDLRLSHDYFNLRVWYFGGYQIVDILKKTKLSEPKIFVICHASKYSEKEEKYEPIFDKVEIDKRTARNVFNKISKYSYLGLKNETEISNYEFGMDGYSHKLEYSDSLSYKTLSYWMPEKQSDTIKDVKIICDIIKTVEMELDLKGIEQTFEYDLGYGKYYLSTKGNTSCQMENYSKRPMFYFLKYKHVKLVDTSLIDFMAYKLTQPQKRKRFKLSIPKGVHSLSFDKNEYSYDFYYKKKCRFSILFNNSKVIEIPALNEISNNKDYIILDSITTANFKIIQYFNTNNNKYYSIRQEPNKLIYYINTSETDRKQFDEALLHIGESIK